MKKTLQLIPFFIVLVAFAFQAMAIISGPLPVTSAATLIAARDGDRMWWTVSNTGTNAAYLKFDDSTNAVTSTNGFYLAPLASVSVGPGGGAGPAQNAVYAITSTNTTTLTFQSSGQR